MAADAPALTDKQIAAEALSRMSDGVPLAEISERLAILAGIERGQWDIDAGRWVSQDEAKRRSAAWAGK